MRLYSLCLAACLGLGAIALDLTPISSWRSPAIAQAQTSFNSTNQAIELTEDANGEIEPVTLNGRLDANSETLNDGSYYNAYTFAGQAGQAIAIEMTSSDFDTYLILLDANGTTIAENDDSEVTNSRISITLPDTGTYTILANSYGAAEIGNYSLSLRTITSTELAQAEGDRLFQEGIRQYQTNQLQAPLQAWRQALEIYQETGDRAGESVVLTNIGAVLINLGQYPQALEHYQQALAIARDIGDRAVEGASFSGIGEVYRNLGQYPQALEYYQQALMIIRSTENRAVEGATLRGIGEVYRNLGQYPRALEYYQQALEIARDIGDQVMEGGSLAGLGAVYNSFGQYPQALEYYQQVLEIAYNTGNQVMEGVIRNNIGHVFYNLGQYPQALEQYRQALNIRGEVGDRAGVGTTLNNIGEVHRSVGQYPQALEYYQQALEIIHDVGEQGGEGVILNNIGEVHRSVGQYPQALEYYQQALEIARDIGDQAVEGATLNGIGSVYRNLGQYSQSLEQHQQALAIARGIGEQVGEGAALINIGVVLYETHQHVAAEETLLQSLVVLESLRASELTDAQKISIFDTQRFTYQFLQQVLIAQNDPEKNLTALAVSERGRGRAFADLLADLQADPAFSTPPEAADIQHFAAEQNVTLVQYSVIDNELGSALYIWVVQPSGEIVFRSFDLTTLAQPLSELVSASREAIAIGSRGATVRPVPSAEAQQQREAEQRQKLQQLHQLLIEPIQDLLPTSAEEPVIFIPHSELFLVPFPALMSAEGRYLIQDHTILTAPSIQVLQFTHQIGQSNSTRNRSTSAEQALVVGNPIMPTLWSPDEQTSEPLPSLPGAEEEAIAISTLFNTEPLMWDEASESAVVQRMQSAQVIHLATHGLLEYGNPQESGVRDFPGAIALAPDSTNDGLLTSSEILNLNLNAELVVLSACDTGRGNLTSDGVIGLSRSLISAGVPSIIVSLWAVDDSATSELMQEFYRRWQTTEQPLDKAQALRQAMLATMQTHPDPKDWAAFTLIGERE
jgi:CHAT domain-containing protein/tetratricopeptide (TPR) repeat protein